MNREIKIRAWARRSNDWEEDGENRKFIMIDGDSLAFEEYAPISHLLINQEDDIYFMTFSGLRDKNKVEIYENDIVCGLIGKRRKKFTGVVQWCNDSLGYIVSYKSDWMPLCLIEDLEIIGNAFENPELLK